MTQCFVNRARKYLFISIAKNASTSIRESIVFDRGGRKSYDSLENANEYVKFMVVRNPFDRIISSFSEVRKLRKDGPWNITKDSSWYREKNLIKSFELFLEFIRDNFYDNHVRPQKDWLDHKGLSLSDIDEILLMDTLREDYNKLIKSYPQILTKSPRLEHARKMPSKDRLLLEDFIESSEGPKERIRGLYQEDCKMYKKLVNGLGLHIQALEE
jgi:hypothetical protein